MNTNKRTENIRERKADSTIPPNMALAIPLGAETPKNWNIEATKRLRTDDASRKALTNMRKDPAKKQQESNNLIAYLVALLISYSQSSNMVFPAMIGRLITYEHDIWYPLPIDCYNSHSVKYHDGFSRHSFSLENFL
ncbi:MAG: hypothetical protein ACK4PK_00570 [Alphaproteobacteria bacterium]